MADEDFDIESLAAYLHLSANEVSRLVERGKVPGRKVAGQWRFSGPEIHAWLEARIGLSDDDELAQLENVLEEKHEGGQTRETAWLTEMLPLEAIAIPLLAKTRGAVISDLVKQAAATGWLWDTEKMADAVRLRESMQSTALDNGVALLHPRRPLGNILGQAFIALGVTSRGIPFGGSRGATTDIFFLICSVDDQGHLRTLARLSRLLGDPVVLEGLRAATTAHDALEVIELAEARLVL